MPVTPKKKSDGGGGDGKSPSAPLHMQPPSVTVLSKREPLAPCAELTSGRSGSRAGAAAAAGKFSARCQWLPFAQDSDTGRLHVQWCRRGFAIASTAIALLLWGHGHSHLPHFAHRHDHNTIDGARVSQCCVIMLETGWICCLSLSLFESYNTTGKGVLIEKRKEGISASCSQQGVHNGPL